ncbi:MAG: hypothetical protein ISR76_06560 [Planctomycetes bacterium]|nr:hypothetical protein [Planctomycetota bacterium]MBL7008642.1 hypothetical protein [Planctomycetota bacterium]
MPNRILNCSSTVSDDDCSVDYSFTLYRPPAGEGGTARAVFGGDVGGTDTTDVDGSAPMSSGASTCCPGGPAVVLTPTSGTWDDVSGCGDITVTLVPS